jgi:putative hydrolase
VADDDRSPEDEFQELMRQLFGASGANLDPDQLSRLSGVPFDPAMMSTVMQHLQSAFSGAGEGGISWDLAKRQSLHIANQDGRSVTAGQRTELDQAFHLAALWVSEATVIGDLAEPPRALTRGQWVEETLPVWQELAEPVATSIADALTRTLSEQAPEELQGVVQGAGRLMRGIGGSLFAAQLGQVVGRLSTEVVSAGEVGIPVMPAGAAAILPQNFAAFGEGLEVDADEAALYIAARELARARLFRHAKWLRVHVIAQVAEIARGTVVDNEGLEDLASRFDPSEPEELRQALMSGRLLQRSESGQAAMARLENILATIEGWVDVVTTDATARLPHTERLAEAARRRRAVGGPAEQALGSLVGLELRPRRLREAAAMWRAVTDAVGTEGRDALWDYPDLMPEASDIDDPSALVARLEARARGEEPARDELDDALAALLAEADQDPDQGSSDTDDGDTDDGGTDDGETDEPRPV